MGIHILLISSFIAAVTGSLFLTISQDELSKTATFNITINNQSFQVDLKRTKVSDKPLSALDLLFPGGLSIKNNEIGSRYANLGMIPCAGLKQNALKTIVWNNGGASANPTQILKADVEILSNNFDNIGVDGFKFDYEQSDGQKHDEPNAVNNLASENENNSLAGSFSFIGDDGVTYTVDYIADENGFQPSAPNIPTA